jgi:hypothetical protein
MWDWVILQCREGFFFLARLYFDSLEQLKMKFDSIQEETKRFIVRDLTLENSKFVVEF